MRRSLKVRAGGPLMQQLPEAKADPHSEPILELANIRHSYAGNPALRGISLDVARGEFLTLLGPSGSGKSTLLRVIAGLEEPDSVGQMRLDGHDIRKLPANLRNVSTVFQHFALFPHMTVGQNVEYSLRLRKVPQDLRRQRAEEALALVRLEGKYERRIHQLSGGERQRVALARSLVMGPDVLLLDEPLGALDERLRLDMQLELIELRRKTGGTFILVTHSQEEAITMSDRIVLMRSGAIEQVGTPRDLFGSPETEFAARFMGVENVLRGTLAAMSGRRAEVRVGDQIIVGRAVGDVARMGPGDAVFVAIRAEHVHVGAGGGAANTLRGTDGAPIYKGRFSDVTYRSAVGSLVARLGDADQRAPKHADLSFSPEHCIVGVVDRGKLA
ncbi:ABC transporter ATP-binding protein [Kaistia adipata]|uniref:ABC transporter ATP-binding protein n=1 Tax=Kaistia adipata TaxID=166954 RepID=UPI00041C7CC2|nr:ABC transporter ATP-binding protein [Kaistia adipata]